MTTNAIEAAYGAAMTAPDLGDPERLGVIVGQAYGTALAERDQARQIAEAIAGQFAEALTHLDHVLAAVPEVASSFARTNDEVEAAREFLAKAQEGGAAPTPEAETT